MATQSVSPDRIVFAVPGTSESEVHADPHVEIGMISGVTKYLSPELYDKYYLPYASEFGNGMSYHISRDNAVASLTTAMWNYSGSEIYLIGYSQGAAVVTLAVKNLIKRVLEGSLEARDLMEKIKGVYLIANPHRQPGMIVGPDPGGEGIAFSQEDGWWGDYKHLVMEICAPGDIIGSSDPNTTFLKRLPGYLNDMNWADLIGWATSVYSMMLRSNPLTLYPELRKEYGVIAYLHRYVATASALYNYIKTGVHVKYATYDIYGTTALRVIANDIIKKGVLNKVDRVN